MTLYIVSRHISTDSEKKEVVLTKKPGQALGIKLASKDVLARSSNTMAVYIENIAAGSPAHTNGKLR